MEEVAVARVGDGGHEGEAEGGEGGSEQRRESGDGVPPGIDEGKSHEVEWERRGNLGGKVAGDLKLDLGVDAERVEVW
mgnify:CR=1 FL=1